MRVILHVGQHKTGSKALQSALYANPEWLASRGFAYPIRSASAAPLRPYEMNHHTLFRVVRDAVDGTSGPRPSETVSDHLRALQKTVPVGAHTLILSAEDLFDMHTAHEDSLDTDRVPRAAAIVARELAQVSTSVKVVVYLRRQDHLLAAHYAQFIKGSNTHDLSLAAFAERFAPRFDADALLAAWEAAFRRANVRVIPYEPAAMPGGTVADFFKRILRLDPPPVPIPFPDDLEAFNITPSRDWLEFMRLLNRRTARGQRALPRAQVLEAAFRDRDVRGRGIAAWLSPAERAGLLASYAAGNRRIAERHGLGPALFTEPVPQAADPWESPPPLSIERLHELEARVRGLMKAGSPSRSLEKMTESVELDGILRG
jgi:hypothetical protein